MADPFDPPQATELSETNALADDTKCPAIFQTTTEPVFFVYAKRPVLSIGMPNTTVGAR